MIARDRWVGGVDDRARDRWVVAAGIALLFAATGLCCFGAVLVTERYDGFVSWLNPLAAASCCGAVVVGAVGLIVLGSKGDRRGG